jgi:hypothetical protein
MHRTYARTRCIGRHTNSTHTYTLPTGDAAPLRIWELTYTVRKIGQSVPFPGAQNTLFVTLAFSTDVRFKTEFFNRWAVRISGLYGAPANTTSVPITDFKGGDSAKIFSATDAGAVESAFYYGGGDAMSKHVVWHREAGTWREETGGIYERHVLLVAQADVRAGQLLTIGIPLRNPVEPQESPHVYVDCLSLPVTTVMMIRDETGLPPGVFGARPGYAMPLKYVILRSHTCLLFFLLISVTMLAPSPGCARAYALTHVFKPCTHMSAGSSLPASQSG